MLEVAPKLTASSSKQTLIGLIEIGSRAVRYLVADFSRDGSFDPVAINTIRHEIDPDKFSLTDVERLNKIVRESINSMSSHGQIRKFVYGTEICRKINISYPNILSNDVIVLTTEQEALGSWAAGFLCQKNKDKDVYCVVIDEGNGSTEIAGAFWNGNNIENFQSLSINTGSAALVSLFEKDPKNYIENVRSIIDKYKDKLGLISQNTASDSVIYIGGGVATKAAWLKLRKNLNDVYKPEKINGSVITLKELINIYNEIGKIYMKSKFDAIEFVDRRKGSESEAVRVISSAPYLALISLNIESKSVIKTTGYGLRHGIGFLIMNDMI